MRLNGCLWHEGISGLGVGPEWLRWWLPYRKLFDSAARQHDAAYDAGVTEADRKIADDAFKDGMLRVSKTPCAVLMSAVYYCAVRAFGWAFFRYDKI